MINKIQYSIATLNTKLDSQLATVRDKIDGVNLRITAIEEQASSRQIVVDNLLERVEDLEKVHIELANSNNELVSKVRELEARAPQEASHAVID